MFKRVDRQAVAGAFVRSQTLIIGLLVPRGAGRRVERSQVDVEGKAERITAHGVVWLVPAEEPMVLRGDPAKVIDDLPLSNERGDFLQVLQRPNLLRKIRIEMHAQDSRSRLRQTHFS